MERALHFPEASPCFWPASPWPGGVIPARLRPDPLGRSSKRSKRLTTTGCKWVSANARRYHIAVTEHRRRTDWAGFIRSLLEGRYYEAERVVLIMDQLNTHSPASLYEAFPPEEAKRLADRLEIHHTPKHGSWLNMAEIELSALGRQCLSRRIARADTLQRQIAAWETERNASTTRVQWQFTTQDARTKLRSLYPSPQP